MAKEIILMSGVEGLGAEGDVVKVADGYARNYLLPRKLAAEVTDATRRQIEKKRVEREASQEEHLKETRALAARIEAASCTIPVKAGESGKMFGSVGTADIADALKEQGIEIERNRIELDDPIRELGVFSVPVKLNPQVETTLKVWVVEE